MYDGSPMIGVRVPRLRYRSAAKIRRGELNRLLATQVVRLAVAFWRDTPGAA